ncbi:hypothetical protein BURMUCF2_1210 [Burkholderia multivorans CF2]|nr:hypothetical protein BURMUCF2_1210 [Burkholderia multivorans CF2]
MRRCRRLRGTEAAATGAPRAYRTTRRHPPQAIGLRTQSRLFGNPVP